MKTFRSIILTSLLIIFSTASQAILIQHIDPVNGYNVIEDDSTGLYWYQLYTTQTPAFGLNYTSVMSSIDSLNATQALGINNWSLASEDNVYALLNNYYGEIENIFSPTYVSTETIIIPDPDITCGIVIPGFFSNPCNDTTVTYETTHWAGIVNSPVTVSEYFYEDRSLECLYTGVCQTGWVDADGFVAINYSILDYSSSQNSPAISTEVVLDNYFDALRFDNDAMRGAWIVGTSPVPLPASFILMLSGLASLAGFRLIKPKL